MRWRRARDSEQDLERELRSDLELEAASQQENGLSAQEARYAAQRALGNTTFLKEEVRTMWGSNFWDRLTQDLRYALRQFRKNPIVTAIVVATLMVGVGANTMMFTIVNGVLLRPLPYPNPDQLIALDEQSTTFSKVSLSYADFQDLQRENKAFTGVAGWRTEFANLTSPGDSEFVMVRHVSAGLMSTLGVNLVHGREFLPEEDRLGAGPVAMIGYGVWQQRFGAAADTVGRTLTLNGKLYTIVGIMTPDFGAFPGPHILVPLGQSDAIYMRRRIFHPGIKVIARLKLGISLAQAGADLDRVAVELATQYPNTNKSESFVATPLKNEVVGDTGTSLVVLCGAVGLVLLIACANVANILLARSISRRNEFAVRAALGAGRARILRQLLTENALLSLLGGAAGLLLAFLGARVAIEHLPASLPRAQEITLDVHVLLFALATSLVTGLIFGLVPALQQWSVLNETLNQARRGTARRLQVTQGGLVIAEVALTLMLLLGAGLMLRTIRELWSVNPGFDPKHVVRMGVALSPGVIGNPALIRSTWEQILANIRAVPGVESAAITNQIPLSGDDGRLPYWASGGQPPPDQMTFALMYNVSADYVRAMKIPLLRGRFLTEQDRAGGEAVVVIDDILASKAFPHQEAVGNKVNFLNNGSARVVGVVGHVKHWGLDEGKRALEEIYFPYLQMPDILLRNAATGMQLMVRTSGGPSTLVPALRQVVLGPGRDQPIHNLETLEDMIGDSLARRRLMLILLAIFAGIALLLASIGIYGVISYSITQRTQEIGIRLALGAQPGDVRRMVVFQGMSMVLLGVAVGAGASLALTRLIKTQLYGVQPNDPLTLGAVVVILALVALGASSIPAWRASRVDPVVALRYE